MTAGFRQFPAFLRDARPPHPPVLPPERSLWRTQPRLASVSPELWPEQSEAWCAERRCRAQSRARSSTIAPPAQFATRTPTLHWAKVLSLSKPVVEGRRGVCTMMRSQRPDLLPGSC